VILSPQERIDDYTARGWWGTRRIHDWFDEALRARPDAEALVDAPNRAEFIDGAPRRLTWRALAAEADMYATAFLEMGLAGDDILCVQLPNCVELPAIYLACLRLGIVVTPVPVQYREHELEHILGVTQPKAIVTAARILHHGHAAMMRTLAAQHPSVRSVLAIDELPRWQADRERIARHERECRVGADDIFTICWTSGTEGVPKGCRAATTNGSPSPRTSSSRAGSRPAATC
jgi:acyl-CoA synthetase (AMP-forming)/AMP-acid ligase II